MTRHRRQIVIVLVATGAALLLAYFLTHPDVARDPVVPKDLNALAHWVSTHPADVIAASALSDAALDSNLPRRRELWRASFEHASHLSPLRPNAPAGFVRAGLFHWYELDDADRKRVLEVAAPLMKRSRFFERMYLPIWSLTHDFAYLRRASPNTINALETLRTLAVVRGLFPQYRELRETIRRRRVEELQKARATSAHPGELLDFAPQMLDAGDAPLAQAILDEMNRKPFAPEQIHYRLDPIVTLALDHQLGPLTGLEPLLETRGALRDVTRARTALALDKPALASRVEISTEVPAAAEWTPYHLERALYEARKGDAAASAAQLREAQHAGLTPSVASAKLEVATLVRNPALAEEARAELATLTATPPAWTNLCGRDELCSTAFTERFAATGDETMSITLTVSQSDETPPYVEVYVNDFLIAESEVRGSRTFTFNPGAGLQRIELRLVNRSTRNGVQRRLRLS
jgi:hypothetical protein